MSVTQSVVINIVRNCKNKKSTGYDGIDMTIIKQVIYHIIKPLTHIYATILLKMEYFRVK